MKKIFSLLIILVSFLFAFQSCKKEVTPTPDTTPNNGNKNGLITGIVYSANGIKGIAGVHVFLNDGSTYSTHTLSSGYFSLSVPAGHYTLHIESGDGVLFNNETEVDVVESQTIIVPPSEIRLECRGNLAYIPGVFDKIEAIVHDSLGYDITMISSTTAHDIDSLEQFDAIFINCGAADMMDSISYANFSDYMINGGSMYVSDYACSYIIGNYSGSCIRPLGFIGDSLLCTNKIGPVMILPAANIVDPIFQGALGTTTMNIIYDLDAWEQIQNYNANFWNVIVSDPTYGALMLSNSSFSANGGKIYYTTFHNNPNGAISNDMENILTYVIVNL